MPGLQIAISDNCSTDGTKEWVRELKATNPQYDIKYFCWDKNMGADLNYMKAIEIADGEYCWFMGSDDQLIAEAVENVTSKLSNGYDTLLFCRINCNYILKPKKKEYALNRKIREHVFNLSNKDELIYYLKNTRDLSALFSYLSTIIIKKSNWDIIQQEDSFIGTAYPHVQKILSYLLNKGTLYYSSDTIVLARMGNDSFQTENRIKRFLIDIDGYTKLGDYYFQNDEKLKYYFWTALRKTRSTYSLFKARIYSQNKDEWEMVEQRLKIVGYNIIQLWIVRKTYLLFKFLYNIYTYKKMKV
jgi:abequosyltransferase